MTKKAFIWGYDTDSTWKGRTEMDITNGIQATLVTKLINEDCVAGTQLSADAQVVSGESWYVGALITTFVSGSFEIYNGTSTAGQLIYRSSTSLTANAFYNMPLPVYCADGIFLNIVSGTLAVLPYYKTAS